MRFTVSSWWTTVTIPARGSTARSVDLRTGASAVRQTALTVQRMPTTNTILAVDGNSLLHRAFHALLSSGLSTSDGRPTWAVKGFLSLLMQSIDRVGADAVVVGFDDHEMSVRKARWPHYKAQRKPKPPELGAQIATTIDLLRSAGVHVVVPTGLEADDVMASTAQFATQAGWHTVIVTSDRDSFALIDQHTSVLRLITGGVEASPILTPERLHTMLSVRPDQYREYAAMRGDTSDNLAGIRGVGEVGAAKLLGHFGSVAAAFADADTGGAELTSVMGRAYVTKLTNEQSRAAFEQNLQIMAMERDVPLGIDLTSPGRGLLPLESERVLAALSNLELASQRTQALAVLCRSAQAAPRVATPVAEPPSDAGSDLFSWGTDPGPELDPAPTPVLADLTSRSVMAGSTAPRPSTFDDLF